MPDRDHTQRAVSLLGRLAALSAELDRVTQDLRAHTLAHAVDVDTGSLDLSPLEAALDVVPEGHVITPRQGVRLAEDTERARRQRRAARDTLRQLAEDEG